MDSSARRSLAAPPASPGDPAALEIGSSAVRVLAILVLLLGLIGLAREAGGL